MSERWIKVSEQLLKGMKALTSKKERDRLEVINSIILTLNALERSIHGWKSWIGNLALMSKFSVDELKEIDETLRQQAESIIKYDVEATEKWTDKFPRVRIPQRRIREGEHGIYV